MIKEDLRVTEEELTLLKSELAEYLLNRMSREEEVHYCKQHMEKSEMLPSGGTWKTDFMREQGLSMNRWMEERMDFTPPYFLVASMLEEGYTFKINPCVYATLVNAILIMSHDGFMKLYRNRMEARELTEENVTEEQEHKEKLISIFVEEKRQMLLNAYDKKGVQAFLTLMESALYEYMDTVDRRYKQYQDNKRKEERMKEEERRREEELIRIRKLEEAKAAAEARAKANKGYTTSDCVRDCGFAVLDTLGELAAFSLFF